MSVDPVNLVTDFLEDCKQAGVFDEQQKQALTEVIERLHAFFESPETKGRFQNAREQFVTSLGDRDDPTPKALSDVLESHKVVIPLSADALKDLAPQQAAGVIQNAPEQHVEIKAVSLLPLRILRVGYLRPEEITATATSLLSRSQQAWQRLGHDARALLNKAVDTACQDWGPLVNNVQGLENWSPATLYDSGAKFYRDTSKAIFIFSTTSGLVVPSEYDPTVPSTGGGQKHPARVRYFEELLNEHRGLKRFYQWNRYSTAAALYRNCSSANIPNVRKASIAILARALQMPNFEITEADFGRLGPLYRKIKTEMTLTSPEGGVVISARTNELKKITHCYYTSSPTNANYEACVERYLRHFDTELIRQWEDDFTASQAVSSHSIPAVLYHQVFNTEVVNIIKHRRDDPLDEQSAQTRAGDVFDRLYREGEKIVRGDLSEDQYWSMN